MKNLYVMDSDITYIQLQRKDGEVLYTTIDTEDLWKLKDWKYTFYAKECRGKLYCYSKTRENGKWSIIAIHRILMDAPEDKEVDHKDGNGLNNRSKNMENVTHQQNMQNQGKQTNNTSGYHDVYWHKPSKKWRARFRHKSKEYHVGFFNDPEEAAQAVQRKRKEVMPYWNQICREGI